MLVRSRRFLLFFAAVVAIGPGFYAPVAFYNDYAVEAGVAPALAAALIGISGATSVVARLVCGALGHRFDPMWLCRAAFAGMTVALAIWWISGGNPAVLIVSAVAHGVGWAVWVTATPQVLANWYGVENLGGVVGIYYTGLGVGALAGPAVCGFIIDAAGFEPAIALVTLTSLIALGLLMLPMRETASRIAIRRAWIGPGAQPLRLPRVSSIWQVARGLKASYRGSDLRHRVAQLNGRLDETYAPSDGPSSDHAETATEYYDICSHLMIYGWGESLHFAPLTPQREPWKIPSFGISG